MNINEHAIDAYVIGLRQSCYDKGWPVQKIAEALLLSDAAIRLHIQDYEVSQKLKRQSGRSAEKLSAENALTLDVHLQVQTYLSVGEIIAYVQQTFGILYTASRMRIWIHLHGFSYKKPAISPRKANQQAQQEWIKKGVCKEILSNAGRSGLNL